MKNCNELLTWTCTYVTEMLKGVSEIPFDQISNPFKATMHGALCLANGLEDLKIQVAQEFGWHSSVMNFSRNHCTVFDGEAYSPTAQDTSLEEEILVSAWRIACKGESNRFRCHNESIINFSFYFL